MLNYEQIGNRANREYKDRVFKLIFGNEERKDFTLSLYNAVNGSSYTNPEDVTLNTIEDAIFMNLKNDVSFIVANTMNVYEHQSTFNPNMPLRCLAYAGALYRKYVSDKSNRINVYSKMLQKIPAPKLICFYNGRDCKEDRIELSLKDAFYDGEETDIDVRVTMLNINYGHNDKLLESCKPLWEYAVFVESVRKENERCKDISIAIRNAIDTMPEESVIKKILSENEEEVRMDFLTEYDAEWTYELFREEGLEVGRKEGREEGILIGEERGENKLSTLIERLLSQGRGSDIKKAIADLEYRKDLYAEYDIQ